MSSRSVALVAPAPWHPGLEGAYPGQESFIELGKEKVSMVFCWCPPKPPGQPVMIEGHPVDISQGFWLAKHLVTQRQWLAVMGAENPSNFEGLEHPVEHVSWHDAQAFCQKAGLRLPAEAEWEHACRAGTATPFAVGSGTALNAQQANCHGGHTQRGGRDAFEWINRARTLPVGQFPPNAWGLHDMHGQLWEWCEDAIGDDRAVRGGGWFHVGRDAASSFHLRLTPGRRSYAIGFRPCPSSIPAKAGGREKKAERGKE